MGLVKVYSAVFYINCFYLDILSSMALKIRCASKAISRISTYAKPANFSFISRCASASPSVLTCGRMRYCAAAAIPEAAILGEPKTYAPKIQNLVNEISGLTLIEVADLNELLKKTLKIADAPVMAMGAVPAQPGAQAAAEPEEEVQAAVKTMFNVKFDAAKKVALIKEIKTNVEGMNLVQAKKFVESAPAVVKSDLPKEEAEKLKDLLAAAGATIEIE